MTSEPTIVVDEGESLLELKRDYWGAKFPSQIKSLDGRLSWNKIFDCTQGPLVQQPPIQYRINFIKFAIKQIESKVKEDRNGNGEEEVDKWYGCLESVSAGGNVLHEPFYRLYDIDETGGGAGSRSSRSNPIKIYEEEKAFVSEGSTGLVSWEASKMLAKWMTINQFITSMNVPVPVPGEMKNEELCTWAVELGCGTGLLAITIMKKFSHVTNYHATDVHPGVLARCQQNILSNELQEQIHVTQLDWVKDQQGFSKCFQSSSEKYKQPGILLGADVIYDVSVVGSLRSIIQDFLRIKPVGKVYFSSAIRNEATLDAFQREIRESNLEIEVVHFWDGKNGVIMEIKNPS